MKNPLLDKEFLKQLDQYRHREVYGKIILLDYKENPIKEIQGVITQGSVNIDGASALRRTCSLTMMTPIDNYQVRTLGFKNKIKLEVGLKNFINPDYPDVIWFKQGLFVITGLSESTSTNSHTINITGQDKMCLLNGTVGGSLPSSIDFGKIDEVDVNGYITTQQIIISQIIKNAVHVYGEEAYENIIINDLDTIGLELLEYRGDEEHPLYMLRSTDGIIQQVSFDDSEWRGDISAENFNYDTLIDGMFGQDEPSEVKINSISYTIAKITYGQTVGYRTTDLVYAGDLIANIGEALTSILDKIKNMLGNFEYFYNIDGKFVFQKKQTYEYDSFNNLKFDSEGQVYLQPSVYTSQYGYEFENNTLLSAFNSNPQLNNVRNDYSVWGSRQSVNGQSIPIHLRIAIDTKPVYYKAINGMEYNAAKNFNIIKNEDGNIIGFECDWREIIYQMALDYFQYGETDGFKSEIIENNKEYYPTGKTGYEKYYTDLQGFWRQLYDPDASEYDEDLYIKEKYTQIEKDKANNSDWVVEYDKLNRLYKLVNYDIEKHGDYNIYKKEDGYTKISLLPDDIKKVYYRIDNGRYLNSHQNEYYILKDGNYDEASPNYAKPQNSIINENPEAINFWFDFIEANESELGQYAISAIGDRPKVINDTNIKALIYKQTPQVLFLTKEELENISSKQTGYTYINMPQNFENYFSISSQGISAYNKFEDLLYQHSYCTDSVSITSVPIYYLQPNVRIKVNDKESGVNGDYLVSKITIPLTYNGTSSIAATKAVSRIY